MLKLQETNESTPTGETPRTYKLIVERYLVDQLVPGNRVEITGIYTINDSGGIKNL